MNNQNDGLMYSSNSSSLDFGSSSSSINEPSDPALSSIFAADGSSLETTESAESKSRSFVRSLARTFSTGDSSFDVVIQLRIKRFEQNEIISSFDQTIFLSNANVLKLLKKETNPSKDEEEKSRRSTHFEKRFQRFIDAANEVQIDRFADRIRFLNVHGRLNVFNYIFN